MDAPGVVVLGYIGAVRWQVWPDIATQLGNRRTLSAFFSPPSGRDVEDHFESIFIDLPSFVENITLEGGNSALVIGF